LKIIFSQTFFSQTFSPVILSQNGGQPWTNCNRIRTELILYPQYVLSKEKQKPRRIPLGESLGDVCSRCLQ